MTGLLQRLAARATGNAWTLRSDARLPFAVAAASMAEVPSLASRDPAAPLQSTQASEGQPPLAQPGQPPTAPSLLHPMPVAAHAPHLAAMGHPTSTPSRQSPALMKTAHTDTSERPDPNTVARALEKSEPNTAAAAATGNTLAPWASRSTGHADPAPLLPPRTGRNASTASSIPQASAHSRPLYAPGPLPQSFTTTAQGAEPAEVHIHIGRIEVTAAPAAQAPRHQARERTQPLSLDAYLARRKEPS